MYNEDVQLIAERKFCDETGHILWGPVIAFIEDAVVIRCETDDGPMDIILDLDDVTIMAATIH